MPDDIAVDSLLETDVGPCASSKVEIDQHQISYECLMTKDLNYGKFIHDSNGFSVDHIFLETALMIMHNTY